MIELRQDIYYPRLPEMTVEEKKKACKIIEESILRAKLLSKKQTYITMNWIKYNHNTDIIPCKRLLFMDFNGIWFPGKLTHDPDHGVCISVDNLEGEYCLLEEITHYMEIELPE